MVRAHGLRRRRPPAGAPAEALTFVAVSRHLFIVSRETPYLADYMREQFAAEPNVEVLVDRRQGADRRTRTTPIQSERRRGDRRRNNDVERQLRECFHALVTVDEPLPSATGRTPI